MKKLSSLSRMLDGKLTSVDNERIVAAREAGIDVKAIAK